MKKKKTLYLISSLLIILTMPFSLFSKSILADGILIKPDPYSARWDYSYESNQQAFINYENGLEKMIITVGLENEDSKELVWLFPLPANPNKITIDVMENLSGLSGEEISIKTKANLESAVKFLQLTQIYTAVPYLLNHFPFFLNYLFMKQKSLSNNINIPHVLMSPGFRDNIDQVVIHAHLNKEGISSEIITAKTADSLYNYLKDKGLKIERASIPILNNYIGKDYSFVVSWIKQKSQMNIEYETVKKKLLKTNEELISDLPKEVVNMLIDGLEKDLPGIREYLQNNTMDRKNYLKTYPYAYKLVVEFLRKNRPDLLYKEITMIIPKPTPRPVRHNQRGILVTFPTKKIYFPLLPTSIYGSKIVPITIRVIGHVSPKVYQNIKDYTKTEYYLGNKASLDYDYKKFYTGRNQNIKYTKIKIEAPSKYLSDDLWFSNQTPLKTYLSTFIVTHPIIVTIILLMLCSSISGILTGSIVFKDLRKKPVKLALIGLSNCLTIIGLMITTMLVRTKNKKEGVDLILAEIKQKEYFWKRKAAAILFFVAFFIALPFSLISPFFLPPIISELGLKYSSTKGSIFYLFFVLIIYIFILIIYSLPIIASIVGFVNKRVKPEDENLFEQLKLTGYSTWFFQPKDKLKIVFPPLFSVSFLIILWLLVKVAEFIV